MQANRFADTPVCDGSAGVDAAERYDHARNRNTRSMVAKPCPHCGSTIRQSRPDWLCVACGKLLPDELRAFRLLPGAVVYNGVPMDPAHVDRIEKAQARHVCLIRGKFYNRVRYGEEKPSKR